jgi:hypothetical protein
VGSDAKGHKRGLAIEWNPKIVKVTSSWSFEFVFGINVLFAKIGSEVTILNLYGPYEESSLVLVALGQKSFLERENIMLGGDINFSLKEAKSFLSSEKREVSKRRHSQSC